MTCLNLPPSVLSNDEPWLSQERMARFAVLADKTGLILLMITVGTLMIRPVDLFPSLDKAPIYEWLIAGCIAFSLPQLLEQLGFRSLRKNSITVMLFLFVLSVPISHLAHGATYEARMGLAEVGKAAILFLLVISRISTPGRLQSLLWVVTAGVLVEASLSVLQHHGLIHMAALQGVAQSWQDPDGNQAISLRRICGIGVFHDPNDFSLILVVAMVFCVYAIGHHSQPWLRASLVGSLALLAYAFFLTRSRGGLTAAAAAITMFSAARFGWRNAIVVVMVVAAAIMMKSSRQTDLNLGNPEDTFQARLGIWSDSLDLFRSEPVFGIGQGRIEERIGHVCHNSYLHAFTETGVLGGMAFAGAFYLVVRGLSKAKPRDRQLKEFMPYLLALVAGYAVGISSLSRCYTVPTQLILGLGTIGLLLMDRASQTTIPQFDGACLRRVAKMGGLLLFCTYMLVRLMITRGHA